MEEMRRWKCEVWRWRFATRLAWGDGQVRVELLESELVGFWRQRQRHWEVR